MMRIAVVDDDEKDAARVGDLVDKYYQGDSSQYTLTAFADGEDLLCDFKPSFDMVLLDIEMERMDGLTCARRLRRLDADVVIAFTTNMAQYAAAGYDVNAVGYLVKPLRYYSFALVMGRAEEIVQSKRGVTLWLADGEGRAAVSSRQIDYVEVRKHALTFHAGQKAYGARGSLREYAEQLEGANFYQCNRYYLVNLERVRSMGEGGLVMRNGDVLEVSRRQKSGLMQALNDYYGMR